METTDHPTEDTELPSFEKKGAICLTNCNYVIVQKVAKSLGMNVVQYSENWDLCWCDSPMDIKRAKDLKKYQKTNHFLGVSEISRKDSLARNLNRMMKHFKDDYNFFPKTWHLPFDYSKLKAYMNQHKSATYIFKPSAGSRGHGIYLSKSISTNNKYTAMICQLYVPNPLLIDGFKFDMRVYILLASCDPLKIYVYNDGIVRLATEPYKNPTKVNLKNVFMHLTNYSVNKSNAAYVDDEISGSKRRITTLNKHLEVEGYDVEKIWTEIDDVIVKTIILAYPFVHRSYKTCFSGHKYIPACFEILGFDILLDDNCKPHLLEVNHSPDLNIHTKVDKIVKRELLTDTFKLLQLDKTFKKIVSLEQKWKIEHLLNADKSMNKQKMIECQKQIDQHNSAWESKHMGNYRLVYSKENESVYKKYFHRNESPLYRNACSFSSQQLLKNLIQKKLHEKLTDSQKSIVTSSLLSKIHLKNQNYLLRSIIDHSKTKTNSVVMTIKSDTSKSILGKRKLKIKKSISEINKLFVKNVRETSLHVEISSIPDTSVRQQLILSDKPAQCEASEDNGSYYRKEIEMIKKQNQKKFPNVHSRLFDKCSGKKECFAEGWNATLIDQVEENIRLADMFDREQLVFKSGMKEHIYKALMKLDALNEKDHVDYAAYVKKNRKLGIKSFQHNKVHVTVIE